MTNKEREAPEERPTAHYISYINPNYSPFDNSPEYITKCSNCGCGLYDTAYYCPICGVKINERVVRSRYNGKIEYPSWIPCSEKMPDINIHVLAQFVMGGMAECYYAHNWWHIVGGFRISGDEVIAWMPLPKPYRESKAEE